MPHRTRILVVDDNQDMVDALLAFLEGHGYNGKGIYSARTTFRTSGTLVPT